MSNIWAQWANINEQQLRLGVKIVVMAAIVFAITLQSTIPLLLCIIAVGIVEWLRYKNRIQTEGFAAPHMDVKPQPVKPSSLERQYHAIDERNPMGNVMLTDINDTPLRKPAPPSFNPGVYKQIHGAAKHQTQTLNSGIKDTDAQLYGGLYEKHQFDNTLMRNFYSTASTQVASDQGAFAKWLYGSMPSSKEDTPEGALMRVKDNRRYILR